VTTSLQWLNVPIAAPRASGSEIGLADENSKFELASGKFVFKFNHFEKQKRGRWSSREANRENRVESWVWV
jgi:hypothetical protein